MNEKNQCKSKTQEIIASILGGRSDEPLTPPMNEMGQKKFKSYDPTHQDYLDAGLLPLLCRGYHRKYNSRTDNPEKDYKKAKEPVFPGWNENEYYPPSPDRITEWEQAGGWLGWRIPKGVIALDVEDNEDIDQIRMICQEGGNEPGLHATNNGIHFLFHIDKDSLSGESKVFTKCGAKVTYRLGGKNYLILAPTNSRRWRNWKPLLDLPLLPDDLLPYDRKSLPDLLNCLSWAVRRAYRDGHLSGYEDLDAALMGFLLSCKLEKENINRAFQIIFGPKYDNRQTDKMIERTRTRLNGGDPILGTGTFLQRVKEQNLREVERFGRELQAVTGTRREIVKNVPIAHQFNLVSAKDLLQEPEERTQWIWEGILPEGGMSLLVAKPKVGKSTLALNLAISVSRGQDFLGRTTLPTGVVYLALEEKRSQIRKRLEAMNVEDEPLCLHFGLAPKGAIEQIDALLAETGAGLLIVDTLQKLARVRDLNDYASVTTTLEPLLAVARARNCHVLLTHHAGKADRTDGDEILGSTALLGAVDTAILLKKREQGRTLSTVQRYGENLPETVIVLGEDYSLSVAGTLDDAKKEGVWAEIRTALETSPGLTESEIIEAVNCRKIETASALRWALSKQMVTREGTGKRGAPFRYKMLPPVPPIYIREGERETLFSSETMGNHKGNSPPEKNEKSKMSGRENSENIRHSPVYSTDTSLEQPELFPQKGVGKGKEGELKNLRGGLI